MQIRLRSVALFIALLVFASPPAGIPANDNGSANVFLGKKRVAGLGSDVNNHGQLGVELTFGGLDWPVKLAVDVMGSLNDHTLIDDYTYVYSYYDPYTMTTYNYYYHYAGLDAVTTTLEVDLGVRKVWEFDRGRSHPYIGGGLALISARSRLQDDDNFWVGGDITDSDVGTGLWVGGGVYWTLGRNFNVGVSARYSQAKVDFDSTGDPLLDEELFDGDPGDVDVGGLHVGLLLGWGW